jgi:hypothetical protein
VDQDSRGVVIDDQPTGNLRIDQRKPSVIVGVEVIRVRDKVCPARNLEDEGAVVPRGDIHLEISSVDLHADPDRRNSTIDVKDAARDSNHVNILGIDRAGVVVVVTAREEDSSRERTDQEQRYELQAGQN